MPYNYLSKERGPICQSERYSTKEADWSVNLVKARTMRNVYSFIAGHQLCEQETSRLFQGKEVKNIIFRYLFFPQEMSLIQIKKKKEIVSKKGTCL